MVTNIITYFKEDIWYTNSKNLTYFQYVALKYVKILLLAADAFVRDFCILRASALTLYTMLSIVPIIAMLFGVSKGFGYQKILEQYLLEQIPEQETMMLQLIGFAEKLLDNTKGGIVAGIGIIVLFWTVIKVISNIEEAFNWIWKVEKGRPVGKKVGDYLSLMLLAPLLLITSSSITVFVTTQITGLIQAIDVPDFGTALVLYLLNFSPMVIMWLLFSFVFIFMPNTKVQWQSGILAGVITGTIYTLVQWGYLKLQIGVSSYNAIYGSFAALPLFIVWLQIAWVIVLFGSEISFFHQNFESYRHHDKYSHISFAMKKILALQILHLIVKQFAAAEKPLTAVDISGQTALPVSVVLQIISFMIESGLIVELKAGESEDAGYQPALDPNRLTIASVIEALENCGSNKMPDVVGIEPFVQAIGAFHNKIEADADNRLIKEI